MNSYDSTQMVPYVSNGLESMGVQATSEIVNCVANSLMPFVSSINAMAFHSCASMEQMVHQLMQQNYHQVMQIAKLRQTKEEMPRMFSENPANGYGYCMDGNKVTIIGRIKIESVYPIISEKNGLKKEFNYIAYYDSSNELHHVVVSPDKLASKNLLKFFVGFDYHCRSKELANDYLAHCIHNHQKSGTLYFPEYTGFIFWNADKAAFYCNNGKYETELMRMCSPYYVSKVIPPVPEKNKIHEAEVIKKYLKTAEEMFLFVYSVCGLMSSFFDEITYPMEQILVISAPDAAAVRKAADILQVYNRGTNPISFDSTKSDVSKVLLHSKDETVIINDCSIVDNEKRRVEMLSHILAVNDDKACQPHNVAIFSALAQTILPDKKKICLTLSDAFAEDMTKAEEKKMCEGLNALIHWIVGFFCEDYPEIKKKIIHNLEKEIHEKKADFGSLALATSYCLMVRVYLYIIRSHFALCCEDEPEYDFSAFAEQVLKKRVMVAPDTSDVVAEEFTDVLNQSIISGELDIVYHSKKMNFAENTNQLIVKEDFLAMEESTIENVILPHMRTTRSVCRLLKCLVANAVLKSTNNNRYPLLVYNKGKSIRLTFIAVYNDILDADAALFIKENKTFEWFLKQSDNEKHIPIVTNSIGQNAYQLFDADKCDNMHFLALGNSGSGKSLCLVERMCTLSKRGSKVIAFDTSHSFTKKEIIEKLSVGGNVDTVKEVKKFVSEHITFHSIEQDGIPVDVLRCIDSSQGIESKVRTIMSIVESHNNFGSRQKSKLQKIIRDLVEKNQIGMADLYRALTGIEGLSELLADTLSAFVNFKCNDKTWGKFIKESKDIIVISTNSVNSSGGSGLIDLLLMSLYYYQQRNSSKQPLSIFVDEIRTQNRAANGPICKILTECRKDRVGLNIATQYPQKSGETAMIMDNAGTKAFYALGGTVASTISRQLGIEAGQLDFLEQGECYVKGTFYNRTHDRFVPTVVHGTTYRNFVKPE